MEKRNLWIPILLILLIVATFVLVAITPATGQAEDYYEEEEIYYGVLHDDSDLYDLNFDTDLVRSIQKALNKYLKKHVKNYNSIYEDGIFGAKTAQAVKLFQYKKGLAIDGICGPKTLKALGIDPTGITSYPRWIPNLETSFARSTSGLALHLNLGSHRLEVYRLVDGQWMLIRVMLTATGNYKDGSFTDLADKVLDGTKHRYISGKSGNKEWRGYFAIVIQNGDCIHSVLAHLVKGEWVFDDNSALGKDVTHGCIRLSRENAEWLHGIIEKGTVCVIDDRAWELDITN